MAKKEHLSRIGKRPKGRHQIQTQQGTTHLKHCEGSQSLPPTISRARVPQLSCSRLPAGLSRTMHANASSVTPRGTPSRRGRSPRFSTDSPSQPGPSSAFADNNGPNKLPTSFVSSLSIRVEGAQPIITPEQNDTTNLPQAASGQESKRAPRKSKTDALAALNSHARATSPSPDDEDPLLDYYLTARPIPVSPKLDLSSVKTSSPRNMPPRTSPRPFDLEDCPEFFPTTEEFRDPMAYIKSISDKGKKYGICKIIPPEGWKMPFVTDTEVRF